MEKLWVDFRAVKAAVTMEMVLTYYRVEGLKGSDANRRGPCPIHRGAGDRVFNVNLTKNVFNCWSCKAHGNVLDFVAAMEKSSVRDAAVLLARTFSIAASDEAATSTPTAARGEQITEPEHACNTPLTFQLRGIDPAHAYLRQRGISREVAELFGVGFFPGKGSMAGRIVIPIHNEAGELVAYAGRSLDGSEPRYKLPQGFHKGMVLFNLHRARENSPDDRVIVVEGFFDCFTVHQAGFPNVVALMGSLLTHEQERLLVDSFREVVLMLDGDQPGRAAAGELATRLVSQRFVRVITVDSQPDQLTAEQINSLLASL